MSDVLRLQNSFEQGTLIRPGEGCATTVDLIRALYRRCGVADLPVNDHVRALEESLGSFDHYVFVLVDGLGTDVAKRCSRGGFFSRYLHSTLQPVFPSTTAAAMTSLVTATYPAQHGVPTWWIYLPDHAVSATILPFVERFGGASLLEHGVEPDLAFPVPSRLPGLTHAAVMVTPAQIADSVYSDFCAGGGRRMPYTSVEQAFELALQHVQEASRPTFTWLYLPGLDGAAHTFGVASDPVARELELYEYLLDELVADLKGEARMAVTADHGLVDVPDDARHRLAADDPLLELLEVPPSGEPAVPVFHVREGQAERFAAAFRREFGEHFALLATDEVEQLELLGPGRLSPETRARLGDFIAVALRPGILAYETEVGGPPDFRAYHAGLSPQEMNVPLLIA